jgi:dTDP-glucose 4,6-dehydratase
MNSMLVTGGAGFIGSNFIEFIYEKYDSLEIICIDKMTYAASIDNLKNVINSERFHFYEGDICDSEFLSSIFEKHNIDVVVNFAAESHVDNSIANPEAFIKTNYEGVFTLLQHSIINKIYRFHQVSTDEVYGDLPIDKPELSFSESSQLKPSSPYSASKAAADLLVLAYGRTYGLNVTISRSTNNYGKNQFHEKLIPKVIKNALSNEPIPVYGNGENIRDWIFVLDHCSAIDIIISQGASGEIYNVGANNEYSNIDLIKKILEELNKSNELIKFVSDRPGHDRRYSVRVDKLLGLGWKPTIRIEDYIKTRLLNY